MRNRLTQNEAPQKQSHHAALFEHALAARAMLERAWSDETAYQNIALQPGDPTSRGQCGVSSVWLSRYLLDLGFNAKFTEGLIYVASSTGNEHVWVEVQDELDERLVVDIASDQYQSPLGTAVHVGTYADTTETIGRYAPEQYFDPTNIPRKKLMGRYAILESNIANLPRRHRIRVPQ